MSANTDPVTLAVVNNRLVNICREMGIAMMKTAYSPIFNEGLDFSCVIFNKDAQMVAEAEFCPAQLGAINYVVEWTIKELGLDSFKPGDVVMHNDPYRGGCHIPEHMVMQPVFHRGKLWGFVANIGHVAEIGGKAPGGFAGDATEVYQEGLRLPPIKLVSEGRDVEDIWKIMLTNHRTPKNTWGDFHAMIGSLHIGERRLLEMLDEYGPDNLWQISQELMDMADRRMRAEISEMADGEYTFSDYMEDEGLTEKQYKIQATVVVRGDEMIVDYTGTDPQAKGPINATYGVAASATYNAVFHVTDQTIPRNAGTYRPIKIIAPPGTIVNVKHPAPEVGGNTETHPRMVEILFGALSQVVPEKVAASDGGSAMNFLFGGIHPKTREPYAHYHLEGGGWGGRAEKDGNNTIIVPNGNCRNTPVEVFETRYPFITEVYELVSDSGGPGRRRGGLGSLRKVKVWAPEITLSTLFDRMKIKPFGLFGGGGGGTAGMYIKKKGTSEFKTFKEVYGTVSPSKFSGLVIEEGDEVILISPGGGGYGDPLEREPEMVLEDIREGFITIEAAEKEYGVVIRQSGNLELDPETTAQLRLSRKES
ncbi:MAG: hydantoinase B/oxoprolinase family protein [Chloroflexi bacterium]|nr:hydantoinase B/oxoprolinase family protein [Chloroflexota bacterium]